MIPIPPPTALPRARPQGHPPHTSSSANSLPSPRARQHHAQPGGQGPFPSTQLQHARPDEPGHRSPPALVGPLPLILLTCATLACSPTAPPETAQPATPAQPTERVQPAPATTTEAPAPTPTSSEPTTGLPTALGEPLATLFPQAGRDDLNSLRKELQTAGATLAADSLVAAENRALLSLLALVLDELPKLVQGGDPRAIRGALHRGFEQAMARIQNNLGRFWQLKLEADVDDGKAMPADVKHLENYDQHAKLGSAMAGFCVRGMGVFLEHGTLEQRRTAHNWFAKAFARTLAMAGGQPVLRPDASTPPARIVATLHAGKMAELLDKAARKETDPTLRAEMEATVQGFRESARGNPP